MLAAHVGLWYAELGTEAQEWIGAAVGVAVVIPVCMLVRWLRS